MPQTLSEGYGCDCLAQSLFQLASKFKYKSRITIYLNLTEFAECLQIKNNLSNIFT